MAVQSDVFHEMLNRFNQQQKQQRKFNDDVDLIRSVVFAVFALQLFMQLIITDQRSLQLFMQSMLHGPNMFRF